MRGIGLRAAAGVMLVACGFDTGGVASGSASVGSAGEDASTGGDDDASDDDGPETADEGNLDDPSTTPESGDPSGDDDPSAEGTTDPSGDPTTTTGDDQGTTGVEPTTDSGDPTTGAMMESSSDGGDDMPPENPYPNCSGDDVCADAEQNCIELTNQWGQVVANACAPPCEDVEDCPGPPQGDATPACVDGYCRLECDMATTTCPDDTQCYGVYMQPDVCLYPD